jgi:aldose 1-epimerase
MEYKKNWLGQINGEEVFSFELKNGNGMSVEVMNYGSTITSIKIPSPTGLKEMVCGFDSLERYVSTKYKLANPYFGSTIGRYGNRIKNGSFKVDRKNHQLTINDSENHLHGGNEGFDKRLWKLESFQNDELVFSLNSLDKEEGYPGELDIQVTFNLNDSNELTILYKGVCTKNCPISLTNHSYFNLSGFEEDIRNHQVSIDSDSTLKKNLTNCCNGVRNELISSTDFRTAKDFMSALESNTEGIDDYYIFKNEGLNDVVPVATFYSEMTGIGMELSTSEPGMQLYTANFLDGTLSRGNHTTLYRKQCAFCCEPQRYPNGPNIMNSPGSFTMVGYPYKSQTTYKFSW